MIPSRPRSPLFPYTTLFRSGDVEVPVHAGRADDAKQSMGVDARRRALERLIEECQELALPPQCRERAVRRRNIQTVLDRKSTRLNSSHVSISYAVFCLKKKS